jgi:hypothetical protein
MTKIAIIIVVDRGPFMVIPLRLLNSSLCPSLPTIDHVVVHENAQRAAPVLYRLRPAIIKAVVGR